MQTSLNYGHNAVLHLDMDGPQLVLDRRVPAGRPLDDPAAAVAAALAEPLDYPPLSAAVMPDDRVTIALAPGVPQAEAVVAGIVYALTEGDVTPERITILQTTAEAQQAVRDVTAGLPEHIRSQVKFAVHDATDRSCLSYLAASAQGQAIYFTREICDADLVIPVGTLRSPGGPWHNTVSVGLYPTFADDEAQGRFHAVSSHDDPVHRRRRREEADEAVWLLGAMFSVQILPGPGDSILHVLVGERGAVAQAGHSICEESWGFDVSGRAGLVIASIDGGPEQQTWENLARALHAAAELAAPEGAIAVCSDLSEAPGPALCHLTSGRPEDTRGELRRDRTPDAIVAARLQRILLDHRVYLLSQLEAEVVEALGIAHVESAAEMTRLCRQHDSCILLGGAQFASPRQCEQSPA